MSWTVGPGGAEAYFPSIYFGGDVAGASLAADPGAGAGGNLLQRQALLDLEAAEASERRRRRRRRNDELELALAMILEELDDEREDDQP